VYGKEEGPPFRKLGHWGGPLTLRRKPPPKRFQRNSKEHGVKKVETKETYRTKLSKKRKRVAKYGSRGKNQKKGKSPKRKRASGGTTHILTKKKEKKNHQGETPELVYALDQSKEKG